MDIMLLTLIETTILLSATLSSIVTVSTTTSYAQNRMTGNTTSSIGNLTGEVGENLTDTGTIAGFGGKGRVVMSDADIIPAFFE
jgi:hypothetical protein